VYNFILIQVTPVQNKDAKMNSKDLIKQLKDNGCVFVRHGKGDHQIWFSPITGKKFSVPHPKKTPSDWYIRKHKKMAGI
jgi:predicted RNA binding protein YcfA (HicA-like mRNA interferase family)